MQKFFLPILLFCYHYVFSQNDSVMYTKDFVFKDGIYITLQDFKNNNPPLTPENFKKFNPGLDYFGEKLSGAQIKRRSLNYPVNVDSTGKIFVDSVFAYVINSTPLILVKMLVPDFDLGIIHDSRNYRIKELLFYNFFKLGKLCIIYPEAKRIRFNIDTLPENLVSIEENIYFGRSDPSTYNGNKYDNLMFHYLKASIFSFDSGNIYKFKLKYFSMLLEKKDKELFREFSSLSKDKQEEMMFIYLNKLNERKPIYFKISN